MKLVVPTLLLWASAIALLGGVALLCAIASDAVPARPHLIPTPADMLTVNAPLTLTAQFCPAPMPICTGDGCKRRSKA